MSQIVQGGPIGAIPGAIPENFVRHFVDLVPPGQSRIPDLANAPNGSQFTNVKGGAGSTFYVLEAGTWTAK